MVKGTIYVAVTTKNDKVESFYSKKIGKTYFLPVVILKVRSYLVCDVIKL